jgi:hypothetical protein
MRKILISLGALLTLVVVGCAGTAAKSTDAVARSSGSSGPFAAAADSKSYAASGATPTTSPAGETGNTAVKVADTSATKQIKTGTITLTAPADRVMAVANQVAGAAETAGGSVDEQRSTSGRHPTSDLVLKVPPDQIHAVMERLAKLAKVRSSDEQTQDVTGQYADMDGRLSTLRISVARLQGFLNKATDANQIAQLEGELTQRESDLESMQGQLNALSARVAQATIHVSITTANAPAVIDHNDPPSPASALARGWSSFTGAVRWTLAGLAVSLPYLALIALLIVAGFRWIRRSGRRAQVA